MARHHIYLSPSIESRVERLRQVHPVKVSRLASIGVELALERMELAAGIGAGQVAQAQAATEVAPPVRVDPEPEVTPVVAPVAVKHQIRIRMSESGVRFDFGDVCRRLGVEATDAYSDLSQPPVMYQGRAEIDLDGVLSTCSMSLDYIEADEVRDWAEAQSREPPA